MRRFVTALACVLSVSVVAAQTQAPAKPAKYVRAVKANEEATIEVIQAPSRRVGNEMVTTIKVRNTSKGSLNLLKADEYWYDKNMKIVSGDSQAHKKAPILPGEIIEMTLRSPMRPGLQRNQILFRHANGDVKARAVKAFK